MPLYKSDAGNILFIHVPKTGGSSIEEHLAANSLSVSLKDTRPHPAARCESQHYQGAILSELLAGVPLHYSFMIVRDPIDRIRSEYLFRTRSWWKFHRRLSFSAWLRYHLGRARENPYHRDNHFRPQVEFEAFSPEIFRFELGLGPSFDRLKQVAGIKPPDAPIHLKRSRPAGIDIARDDLEAITAFYRPDFERYGYRPGGLRTTYTSSKA